MSGEILQFAQAKVLRIKKMELNKKIALIAAGSLLSVGGLYAVSTSANAATPVAPVITSPTAGVDAPEVGDTDNLQEGDQNGVDDATESATESATEDASDGADVGSDMNASEPGHQDTEGADDANEAPDATEVDGN